MLETRESTINRAFEESCEYHQILGTTRAVRALAPHYSDGCR